MTTPSTCPHCNGDIQQRTEHETGTPLTLDAYRERGGAYIIRADLAATRHHTMPDGYHRHACRHEDWHPMESPEYLRAAIARVNGEDERR